MSRFVKFLNALFSALIVVNLCVYVYFSKKTKGFYKPSDVGNFAVLKNVQYRRAFGAESNQTQSCNSTPDYVAKQIENLESLIPSLFVKVRNGVKVYPALVVKVEQEGDYLYAYLLTFYPMDWQFAKLNVKGFDFFPKTVYLCTNGIIVLRYELRGTFLETVETGDLGKYGLIAVPNGGISFSYKPLINQTPDCRNNGFVFNLNGDFSGVCFGGKFLGVGDLKDSIPSQCQIIFQGGKDGNLQG